MGRGRRVPGAAHGSAGGAACGDLIRVSVRVDGDRVAAAGFDAEGCGALTAAGSAAVLLVDGEGVLDAARVGAREIAAELGGLSPGKLHAADLAADALHRALGAAVRAGAALAPSSERTLIAMSGGVDSAVAALLVDRAGRDAVAVTLELWADPANDAEASCCSAHAVRIARAVAHRMGMAHLTLDLRDEFRAGVVDPFLSGHAAGETPNPCVNCNGHVRLDAMIEYADALGAADLATGHYARRSADGLLRAAADPAKDQTYMLAAVAPETLARLRFPLGELTKPEVRAIAAEAGLPVAAAPTRRTSASSPGPARRRSSPATASSATPRATSSTPPGTCSAPTAAPTTSRSGSARASASARPSRSTSCAPSAPPTAWSSARGRRSRRGTVAVRGARLHRDAARSTACKLRYRSRPVGCRVTGDGALAAGFHPRLELELDEPVDGAAPGQTACLLAGDVVVGWATIGAAQRPASSTSAM